MDEGAHHFALIQAGFAIARWAPWQDVGDVALAPILLNGCKHFIQQLPCPTHEWNALHILLATRRFPDTHEPCIGIAITKNQIFG